MDNSVNTIVDILSKILGEPPKGLEFIYILLGGLLLVFVFHLLEHILETFFGKFFNR